MKDPINLNENRPTLVKVVSNELVVADSRAVAINPALDSFFGGLPKDRPSSGAESAENKSNIVHLVENDTADIVEYYRLLTEHAGLDANNPDHQSRRAYLEEQCRELEDIYGDRLERRSEDQLSRVSGSDTKRPLSEPTPQLTHAMNLFFSEGPLLTHEATSQEITVEPSFDEAEAPVVDLTVPCPFCYKRIHPDSVSCEFCNQSVFAEQQPETTSVEDIVSPDDDSTPAPTEEDEVTSDDDSTPAQTEEDEESLPFTETTSKNIESFCLVLGVALTVASIGVLAAFQWGFGVEVSHALLGTSVYEFLVSGSNSSILSIALALIALECLFFGRFLSKLDGKILVDRDEYSDDLDED